jgi:tetratricopeptide (TPR) repeat protein
MRTAADLSAGVRELVVTGRAAWQNGEYARARGLFERVLARARADDDRFGECAAYHFLANIAFNECRDDESRRLHLAALEIARAEGDEQGIATSLGGIAYVDLAVGDLEASRRHYDAAIDAYERAGMSDAARSLQETSASLLDGRVRLEDLVPRRPGLGVAGQP